jgi:DNA-binding response OmpR family regulator
MTKIVVIEDDQTIVNGIEDTLQFHEYKVLKASNGKDGLEIIQKKSPHLVILDIMLPDLDGFDICKKIKAVKDIPVIMLTAKSQESDKLLGFEVGADDYITKPFSIKELVARVKAVLKRSSVTQKEVQKVVVGAVNINFKNFTVLNRDKEYPLSPKEHKILQHFVQHPDRVIDRDTIIDTVWGDEYDPSPRTIDNFILKLRMKIEENPKKPEHILTVHGAGYKFCF